MHMGRSARQRSTPGRAPKNRQDAAASTFGASFRRPRPYLEKMARSESHEGMSRVLVLRERITALKARRASTQPPPARASQPRDSADATGPCAGVMGQDVEEALDSLVQLEVQLGSTSDSNLYVGFSQDVARGGVLICTHQHLDLMREFGRRVAVTMHFPGGQQTRALGVVCFARDEFSATAGSPPGLGIKFLSLTDAGHALIHRFAARREPIFYCD